MISYLLPLCRKKVEILDWEYSNISLAGVCKISPVTRTTEFWVTSIDRRSPDGSDRIPWRISQAVGWEIWPKIFHSKFQRDTSYHTWSLVQVTIKPLKHMIARWVGTIAKGIIFGVKTLLVKNISTWKFILEVPMTKGEFCWSLWYKPTKKEIGDFLWLVIAHYICLSSH